MEGIDSQPL